SFAGVPPAERIASRRASTRRRYSSTRSANAPVEARAIMAGHRSTETARAAQAFVNVELSRAIGVQSSDIEYQSQILPGVSRTFALTIPVLPQRLAEVVTNAYLLCRIADTIEDDVGLDNEQKSRFHERFIRVVEGGEPAEPFAAELAPLLSDRALPAERDLVENTPAVIRVTHGFSPQERDALSRCVRVMCEGMPEFARNRS